MNQPIQRDTDDLNLSDGSGEVNRVLDTIEQMHPRYLAKLLRNGDLAKVIRQRVDWYQRTMARLQQALPNEPYETLDARAKIVRRDESQPAERTAVDEGREEDVADVPRRVSHLAAGVPEPATFVLLILAAAGICIRRHRSGTLASRLVHEYDSPATDLFRDARASRSRRPSA